MDGGIFRLDLNGVTTTIQSIFDGYGYAGLQVKASGGNKRSTVLPGALLMYNTSGVVALSIGVDVGYGSVSVRDAFGTERAYIDGSLGRVGCRYLQAGDPSDIYSLAILSPRSTFANSGSASPLPLMPDGYFYVQIAGGLIKRIPYYN